MLEFCSNASNVYKEELAYTRIHTHTHEYFMKENNKTNKFSTSTLNDYSQSVIPTVSRKKEEKKQIKVF